MRLAVRAPIIAAALALAIPAPAGATGLASLPFLGCYDPGTPGCTHPFAGSGGTRADVTTMTADGKHLYVAVPTWSTTTPETR